MDDLKHRFLELINKENVEKIPIVSSQNYCLPTEPDSPEKKTTPQCTNEEQESDTLESVEKIYFSDEQFDPSRYELEKLSELQYEGEIKNNLHKLQSQLAVVSKRVLCMILENQSASNTEFIKMQEIKENLDRCVKSCRAARLKLSSAQTSFTSTSLGILNMYRRRKITQDLLGSLYAIRTLLKTEARLDALLKEEDLSGAISLLLECQQVASTYRHFYCVAALSGKLQDTLVMAEEQLDVTLAKMCHHFDSSLYMKLQEAYGHLGKRRMAMDQLHMHYTSAIHNCAFNIVHKHVLQDVSPIGKKPYATLCKHVLDSELIDCLLELCRVLWNILRSYTQVVQWHNNINNNEKLNGDNFEHNINEQYIKQKLNSGLNKLWHDVQSRIAILISTSNVSVFKFDDFLQVLAILHRLVQIGEEFCKSESKELQNSIKGQCSNYFRNYHLSRLEELKLFLENEAWTPCPVKSHFNLLCLQEFRNLRLVVERASFMKTHSRNNSLDNTSSTSSIGYFSRYTDSTTPFDAYSDSDTLTQDEDILLADSENSGYGTDESEDEMNTNCNDMSPTQRHKKNQMLVTNTTLTVLRHCGRYLQMSRLLHSIMSDVIVGLRQLFEYYLYVVCVFFATDLTSSSNEQFSRLYSTHKLQATLKRIKINLIRDPMDEDDIIGKVLAPCISPTVDLTDREQLHGLCERVVGVESVILLAEQFEMLRDYLESQADNDEDKHTLSLFYSQVVAIAQEVRRPVYDYVARKTIDSTYIINLMSKVNWEVKDVMCQHSQYVDVILRDLQVFVMRLEAINERVTIPQDVITCLWESLAELIADIFVEGFSNAKKCSNGGRALMQLDFTQLTSKMETLSGLKPIPKKEYVEVYVKAYYLPEIQLQSWITDHKEYSSKQLLSLVSCVCHNNKKSRQRLTSIIEDMERR